MNNSLDEFCVNIFPMNYFVESRWGCRIHADDADSFIALTFRSLDIQFQATIFGSFRALSIAFFSNNLSSFVYCTYYLGNKNLYCSI